MPGSNSATTTAIATVIVISCCLSCSDTCLSFVGWLTSCLILASYVSGASWSHLYSSLATFVGKAGHLQMDTEPEMRVKWL